MRATAHLSDSPPDDAPARDTPARGAPLGVDVALLWRGDMLAARFFPRPQTITVGPRGTFILPEDVIGRASQTLVDTTTRAGFGLHIDNPRVHGHVIVGGDVHDVAELQANQLRGLSSAAIPLTAATRAVLVFGDFTFIVSREPVPPPARFGLWNKEMIPLTLCWVIAAAVTVGPLVAAFYAPAQLQRHAMVTEEPTARRTGAFMEIAPLVTPPPAPAPPDGPEFAPPQTTAEIAREVAAEAARRRQADTDRARVDRTRAQTREDDAVTTQQAMFARQLDAETDPEARAKVAARIVAAEADAQVAGIALMAVTERDDPDAAAIFLNPSGARDRPLPDTGAHATPGAALMSDSPHPPALGGEAATHARSVAALARKQGAPVAPIRLHARPQAVVHVSVGRRSRATGALPDTVIRAYIRRKMGAIKACYQKGLQQNPALAGKVQVRFLIQPSGAILGAKVHQTSLHDTAVEGCILANVASWTFPAAVGGGSTRVFYPFRFTSR